MSRILMVTPVLKSQRGNSITAARLYNGLSRKGYAIDLVSLDEPGWQQQIDRCAGTDSYKLLHGLHALQFSAAAVRPAINNIPMIITATGTDINFDLSGPHKEDVLAMLRRADKIAVFNPDMARLIKAADPHLESRLSVIPQGIDLPAAKEITRQQLGLPENSIVFVIPSGLRPVKNLDLALDGLDMAHRIHPRLSLLIVGAEIDTVYTAHIKSRISRLSWVKYTGEVPHEKIAAVMGVADVVLNTSIAEGQPQAVLEAMSLGKPCIMTSVPGNIGIIKDGIHGYYIDTARDLADAALRLMNDQSLVHDMGDAARKLVNDRYSVEKEIDAYAGLYEALLP